MYRRRVKKAEKPVFPTDLEGFGYVLKEDNTVRSIHQDTSYEFEYLPKDRPYNEARYDAFINIIGEEVEKRLQQEPLQFSKMRLPVNAKETEPHTYIYMTPNALTTTDKLMLLIPGNNTRVGQWSKRVMCDENINSGSVYEVATLAQQRGYETVVFNPNGIYWYNNKAWEVPPMKKIDFITVPENDSPEMHCQYVFQHFIRKAQASKIAVMTSGWGGYCFTEILNHHFEFIKERVLAVAMTDSVHSRDLIHGADKRAWMLNHAVNWAVSEQPRGEIINDTRFGCQVLSSNVEIADFSLPYSLKEIIRFIDIRMGDLVVPIDAEEQEDVPSDAQKDEALEEALKDTLNILSIG